VSGSHAASSGRSEARNRNANAHDGGQAFDHEHPPVAGRDDQVAGHDRHPCERHRVPEDEDGVRPAALGSAEPVQEEHKHRRDDNGLRDPEEEAVDELER
jgi:hypothetical protein